MNTTVETQYKQYLSSYLAQRPEVADNLKPNSEQQIAHELSKHYIVREQSGEQILVNPLTNLAVENVDAAIKKSAMQFLKSRGQGKLVPQFADKRNDKERESQEIETGRMFDEFIKRSPVKYVSEEPLRILKTTVSKNLLFENDGQGSFVLVTMMNGVPIEKQKPQEVLDFIRAWSDDGKTELEQKRLDKKFRDEALALEGLTLADLNDKQKKSVIESTVEKLKREYYSIPTQKKLPEFGVEELKRDLRKTGAWEKGYPISESDWTLQQKITLEAYADQAIEDHKKNVWEPAVKILSERTPAFYKSVIERFSGLTY